IQTAEHQDTTKVTLLATFAEYPGLQVRWWKDDSIIDVTHKPGHLVMNIGQLLSYTSGGALKATKHRVIDCCGDRLSVPFFLEPRFHANVNVVLPGCEQRESQPKYYGHWLLEGIR
ncbi:1-aminocyclopropane-1-carboxylate oxidase-like, partial [Eriocheir sinensis]